MSAALRSLTALIFLLWLTACSHSARHPHSPHTPAHNAIASAHPAATEAGMAVLRDGGNAFDAAIAVAASLGVVEPYSAGLGGGGFWLLYDASQQQYRFIDAREKAPLAAHRDYYLDADGKVDRDRAINGPTAAAIPGQAAAFAHIASHYGTLPLTRTLQAAIDQAQHGFAVDDHYRMLMNYRLQAVRRYPHSASIFLDNNEIPRQGHILRQPDLAATLQRLAEHGHDGFYDGETAQRLLQAVQQHGGDWQAEDLQRYQVVEREPLQVRLGNNEIISAPPPSSGGIALIQMLSMLSQTDWQQLDTVPQTHLLSEIMRRAYHDRARYLGDPDFVDVPVDQLLSEQHNAAWLSSVRMDQATPSLSLKGPANISEGFHTTHLSVIDKAGNMVSATLSINLPFGSAFTAEGTGVLLNNEMDDFSAAPGAANAYGLTGNEANAIAPGKRPLSSMTPTIVRSAQQTAIIGTPGGSRIITMVLLGTLEHLQGKPVDDWVSRKRFHHQYLPDVIQHEPDTFSTEEKAALQALGHQLKDVGRQYGNMQAILWQHSTNRVHAASDPRAIGQASVE